MRISDWSSDVCSSDRFTATGAGVKSSVLFLKKHTAEMTKQLRDTKQAIKDSIRAQENLQEQLNIIEPEKKIAQKKTDRKSDVKGQRESERVNHGGRRIIIQLSIHNNKEKQWKT